jgi:hypothetical protein
MRKVAILLTLTMLLSSLAGCAGDDESASPVGVWYFGENMWLEIKEDGTLIDGEGNSGTWSVDGDSLTLVVSESSTVLFVVEGDWLWVTEEKGEECTALAPESIDDDEWDDAVSEKTLPSICGSAR